MTIALDPSSGMGAPPHDRRQKRIASVAGRHALSAAVSSSRVGTCSTAVGVDLMVCTAICAACSGGNP
jgi:hypothetical protein